MFQVNECWALFNFCHIFSNLNEVELTFKISDIISKIKNQSKLLFLRDSSATLLFDVASTYNVYKSQKSSASNIHSF